MNNRIQPLEIQKYIKLAQNKEVISFAAGLPDLSVLPIEKLMKTYGGMLEENPSSFQYRPPIDCIKKKIQAMMATQAVECDLDEILITNGAQQAIYLTANLFLQHNATMIIEEFVYPGFLQIANMFDLNYLVVPSHCTQGIDLDYLETLLKTKTFLPFLYVVCNGHNPQGITLTNKVRKHLAYLAEKYNFIIVEDDPYGYLNYSDAKFLPVRAYTRNSIYIGSFSKIISPALRVGWIVGEKEIIQKLHQLKDMNDLYVSNPNHLVLNKLLDKYSLPDIIQPQKDLYRKKLDCIVSALHKNIKVPFDYVMPQHGMFIWIDFPDAHIESNQDYIFEESKTLYIPASAFAVNKSTNKQAIRLNFTYPSFEEIELGIRNLAIVLSKLSSSKEKYAAI